jgi:hypothetical protein|nr:MAG TPA: YopX protein [Caudoviricetes sp.]
MNNLKFRAWNKKLKLLGDVSYIDFNSKKIIYHNGFVNYYVNFEDVEIMQSTGLKDKNGKEIFEGDIINCGYLFNGSPFDELDEYEEEKGVVKFVNCGFNIKFKNDTNLFIDIMESCEDIEVIGNIYENKELLRK